MRFTPNHSNLFLTGLGGILWWAAWPTSPFTFIAFIAFVPLLWVEDNTKTNKSFFWQAYLYFFIWNGLTTWWIYHASFAGAALAIVLNSLLMCLPWLLMRTIKKSMGRRAGYLSLIFFWISFEYIHQNWELSWPWLTLGNVFAQQPHWVQWYEITGVTGGSLWILISNIGVYFALVQYRRYGVLKKLRSALGLLLLLWFLPLLFSGVIYDQRKEIVADAPHAVRNIVVVQPNVDPYNEKFTTGTQQAQIENLITLSEQQIDSATALVVWPETAIPVPVDESAMRENPYYEAVWQFLSRHPELSLLSGIDSYRIYGAKKKTTTARFAKEEGLYFDAFNTAALFSHKKPVLFYHKAKLVPGVETLPSFLLWMGNLFEGFGGTSGTLGRDAHRVVFADQQHYYQAAPIICYESVYGDYVTEYVRKGANVLAIITNDGWWGNTQGYRQHMEYARLRAIETRRWIARSANTGISCFIDPLGAIYQPQPWDTRAAIKRNIEPLQMQTFFVRHGDYLSRIINVASIIFLLIFIVYKWRNRNKPKTNPHVPAHKL